MIEGLFWSAIIVLVYTYVGFPLVAWLRAQLLPKPAHYADIEPRVTLLIVAHNEAEVIQKKLENVLSLDYPKDRLEIILASDGSDDGTNQIVEGFRSRGIQLLALPRRGKIATINEAVMRAHGEILAFSDANSMYAPQSLRALLRPFGDATVGGVAGDQLYLKEEVLASSVGGECTYWYIDRTLKRWQSQAGSVTSATGAIYAIRRALFRPLPGGVCDDATISYRVIEQGFRMVFEPQAVAYEHVASSPEAEFRRKVRICAQGLLGILDAKALLNPWNYGFYSIQLFSHKLLRWMAVWPLGILLVTSFQLVTTGPLYMAAATVQSCFYGPALIVHLFRSKRFAPSRLLLMLSVPFYFCLANVAFLQAQLRVVQGQRFERWEVSRGQHQQVPRPLDGSAAVQQ